MFAVRTHDRGLRAACFSSVQKNFELALAGLSLIKEKFVPSAQHVFSLLAFEAGYILEERSKLRRAASIFNDASARH
jgi:hypothetical protein